jgi:predicted phosphoribosyltransferase
MAIFLDRTDAGRRLAQELQEYTGDPNLLVLALPRGGVPVAYEVARALGAPLDIFLVRKLGLPGQPELAMGAIATGGVRVLNEQVVHSVNIDERTIDAVTAIEQEELERRASAYRGERPAPDVRGRTIILIDDGLATGATMRVAIKALRPQGPEEIVVAVPLGAPETCAEFEAIVDDVVCVATPEPFLGIGAWYDDFPQMTDDEVRALLDAARQEELHRDTQR